MVAGYLDGQSRHGTRWQLGKIKSPVIVFLFWITIYHLPVGTLYQRGYLIQPPFPWFAFVVIYTFHPAVEWLSQRRALFCSAIAALLFLFLRIRSAIGALSWAHALSSPQYRLWTWAAVLSDGQLFADRKSPSGLAAKMWSGRRLSPSRFIYLFHPVLRRHFFSVLCSKPDRNAFILTGSQIYILIIAQIAGTQWRAFRLQYWLNLKSPFWPLSAKR